MTLRIAGRSSSHFTRTVRVFAHELERDYVLEPVFDLMAPSAATYAGNPALTLPVLITDAGAWFGALNCCRELARCASRSARSSTRIVWPEDLTDRASNNAQELVLQGMATEVGLIMRMAAEPEGSGAYTEKARLSLRNSVEWLDAELPGVLQCLPPERNLSFLEVSSFCFVTHLDFRRVLDTSDYAGLRHFCREFGQRASALETEYRFDSSP